MVTKKIESHFGSDISQSCTTSDKRVAESMFIFPVTGLDIGGVVSGLSSGRSVGCDGVSAKFVMRCSHIIADVVALLINLSFEKGSFPDVLKISTVVPVPKKGSASDIENYRPISLMSIFFKNF